MSQDWLLVGGDANTFSKIHPFLGWPAIGTCILFRCNNFLLQHCALGRCLSKHTHTFQNPSKSRQLTVGANLKRTMGHGPHRSSFTIVWKKTRSTMRAWGWTIASNWRVTIPASMSCALNPHVAIVDIWKCSSNMKKEGCRGWRLQTLWSQTKMVRPVTAADCLTKRRPTEWNLKGEHLFHFT